MGMGAGTGRGRGNCSQGVKRGLGLAIGMGLGLGLKRGFRNFWRLNQSKEDELKELKTQAEVLEQGLSKVKERINELENKEGD
jgi:hypothetical protein